MRELVLIATRIARGRAADGSGDERGVERQVALVKKRYTRRSMNAQDARAREQRERALIDARARAKRASDRAKRARQSAKMRLAAITSTLRSCRRAPLSTSRLGATTVAAASACARKRRAHLEDAGRVAVAAAAKAMSERLTHERVRADASELERRGGGGSSSSPLCGSALLHLIRSLARALVYRRVRHRDKKAATSIISIVSARRARHSLARLLACSLARSSFVVARGHLVCILSPPSVVSRL